MSGHDVIEDTDTDYICDSPELRDDAGDPPGVGDRVEDDNRADTDHVRRKLWQELSARALHVLTSSYVDQVRVWYQADLGNTSSLKTIFGNN